MALSIRNSTAEKLAREVAKATGQSITRAIIEALEEKLERLQGRRTASDTLDEIMRISLRCKALPDLDGRNEEEILGYGQDGIPTHGH